VPDTSEKQKRKAKKVKQQIQWELRSKAKNSEEAKGSNCAPGLTKWLLPTIRLVSVEEYSDGSIHHSGSVAIGSFRSWNDPQYTEWRYGLPGSKSLECLQPKHGKAKRSRADPSASAGH
jgi:hypothetical protein